MRVGSIIGASSGFVLWLIAAWLHSSADVGVANDVISAMRRIKHAFRFSGFDDTLGDQVSGWRGGYERYDAHTPVSLSIQKSNEQTCKIEVHGTLFLIFMMVRMRGLKKEEASDKVNLMIREGFRHGHEEYLEFLNLLENA
ncbi:MAG: hypothetical protein CHKLHMKO_00069 [Candidatus Argoarchaeum ethanivorans]|uniref:Uncharacterized protein n=1 Tax=Candidatus Argoarchaeum ethanivorans TaxID=2608793 RepID=A0A811T5E5_9EURY|nr:MAG: hypothetical protein CHKLHMKO_00069 [Candidatus Argoarchaeum ethanivorans]